MDACMYSSASCRRGTILDTRHRKASLICDILYPQYHGVIERFMKGMSPFALEL